MAAAAATAAAAEAARSGPSSSAGDSYVGSLISLTSKSEIRYEGILYEINTLESSIRLRNVRSFGTEGRKKDGPQIPPSDKIYEYILFRGSDIKDLQVKSSPSAQNSSIHDDPAIIQSQYPHPPPPSSSFPSVGSGTAPDLNSHAAHLRLLRPPFQGNLPLYQPTGSLGSWGSSPMPPALHGSGLAVPGPVPMYWPGYYAPTGMLPHLQQSSLMHMPPGLSNPQSIQQPFQYPAVGTSLASGSQTVQELPSPLLPTFSSTLVSTSTTSVPSTLAPLQASALAPETSPSPMPNKPIAFSLPAAALGANNLFLPKSATSIESVASLSQDTSASSNPSLVPVSNAIYQTVPQPMLSMFASSGSTQAATSIASVSLPQLASKSEPGSSVLQTVPINIGSKFPPVSDASYQTLPPTVVSSSSSQDERPLPPVTPDKLQLPTVSAAATSETLQTSHKDVEVKPRDDKVKPLLTEPSVVAPAEIKDSILPLPTPHHRKPIGAAPYTHDNSRGRGRGRGRGNRFLHTTAKFTEDFDFTAMNEKFNKDEVWGHLGKNKAQATDMDGDDTEEHEVPDEAGDEPSKSDSKPVYVKDDFFDTLSCDALDRGRRGGRPRFSEQLKIDTETFGEFPRHRGARGGGRGFRGGGYRGAYYGRGGYGYGGRGRGQNGPYRTF